MDKTSEILALRKEGHTIREISEKTDVPRSTVHRILQRHETEEETVWEELDRALLVHLPITFFCPRCGKEQRHAYLCPLCGKFIPAECDSEECATVEFDLSTVKLGNFFNHAY